MAIIATGAAQPGDVIVMAANSDLEGHTWGSGLTLSAKNVGCEGVVVDGLVIDSDSILALQVPVFCRGSTLRSKGTEELGSVNVPVVCGGVDIRPGDLVLGSLDGVYVIPQEELESRIQEAEPESARIQANIEKLVTSKGTIFDLRGGRGMARKLGIDWPE